MLAATNQRIDEGRRCSRRDMIGACLAFAPSRS